ncbi:MAG TPA: hypothetical protein VK469_00210, partial [Candidatus Kapabacteria bacterium]|nr:hypothetical protein [Candidatus Kapabacteria bacterium]
MRTIKIIILIFTVFLLFSTVMFSQYSFYYGKNKVHPGKFNWQYIETPHFNIHYYTANKELIKKIANAAEFSYSNISNYLNVKIPKRIPLIFYTTHIDFELTN